MPFLFVWFLIQISFNSLQSITYPCSSNSRCGCSSKSAIVTKIVGGEEAGENTWGWAISIRLRDNHICGGSLISPELVLTAAHCFVSISELSRVSVTAGSRHLFIIKQQQSISKVYIHRDYDSVTYRNDIAVIRLSSPFNMNDPSLSVICLPNNLTENNTNNTNVVAIGWGVLSAKDEVASRTLQQVTLKTVANNDSTCRKSIRDTKVQLCAGVSGGGKDTCQGDSGGPLMMFSNNRWYLLGITSYGNGCAEPGYAGVYTRVSTYDELINCFFENNAVCIKNTFVIRNSGSLICASIYLNIFFIFYFT